MSKQRVIDLKAGPPAGTAAHIRLTPALKDALVKAKKNGERVTIKFVEARLPGSNVICVGEREFDFRSVPEKNCYLLDTPQGMGANGSGSTVAVVKDKLWVHRKLDLEEISRQRKEKAAAQARPKAVTLESHPMQGVTEKKVVRRIVRQQDRTQAAKNSSPPNLGPRPTMQNRLPPGSKMSARGLDDGIKPQKRSPDTVKPAIKRGGPGGQLGIFKRKPLAAPKVEVSNEAAINAARLDNPKMCLMALLTEKPYAMKNIAQAVVDAYHKAKQSKRVPPKEYITRVVQSISDYDPRRNRYSLKQTLKDEVDDFVQANGGGAKKQSPLKNKKGVNSAKTAGGGSNQRPDPPGRKLAAQNKSTYSTKQHAPPSGIQKDSSKQSDWKGLSKLKRPRSTPTLTPNGITQELNTCKTSPDSDLDALDVPPRKFQRTSLTSQKLDSGSMGTALDNGNDNHSKIISQGTQPKLPTPKRTSKDEPRVKVGYNNNGGEGVVKRRSPDSEMEVGNTVGDRAGVRETIERKVSEEGPVVVEKVLPKFLTVEDVDESWFEEFLDRAPEQATEINETKEFEKAQVNYQRKHKVYLRLYNLIDRNRQHFEELTQRLSSAREESEQDQLFRELQSEWQVTGMLSVRWDMAFKNLHEELGDMRTKMEAYIDGF